MIERAEPRSIRFRLFLFVAGVATLAITLLRFEVVQLPPYWDSAMGLWSQANAIFESDFDVRQHLLEEPDFLKGGFSSNRQSVVPWFIAGLMAMMEPAGTFVTYHLLVFAMAGCSFALLFALLVAEVPGRQAAVATFAAFAVPVFNVQFDQLGLEVFLSVMVLLTALCVFQERFLTATLIASSSFFMKQAGCLITLALLSHFAFSLLLMADNPGALRFRRLRLPFVLCLAAFSLQMTLMSIDVAYPGTFIHFRPSNTISMALWYPGLILASLVAVGSLCEWIGQLRGSPFERHWENRIGGLGIGLDIARHIVSRHPVLLYAWFQVLVVVLGMLVATSPIPRYVAFAVPMLYFIIGFQASQVTNRRGWDVAIICLLAFDLLNWSGRFLPSAELAQAIGQECEGVHVSREGTLLERSHEYLPDLKATISAARTIEKEHRNDPVIVGPPFAYFLTIPRLGYVTQPIRGYLSGWVTDEFRDLRSLQRVLIDAPMSPIFIRQPTTLYLNWSKIAIPPPRNTDDILYTDRRIPTVEVYRKRLDRLENTPEAARKWYREHLIGADSTNSLPNAATRLPSALEQSMPVAQTHLAIEQEQQDRSKSE